MKYSYLRMSRVIPQIRCLIVLIVLIIISLLFKLTNIRRHCQWRSRALWRLKKSMMRWHLLSLFLICFFIVFSKEAFASAKCHVNNCNALTYRLRHSVTGIEPHVWRDGPTPPWSLLRFFLLWSLTFLKSGLSKYLRNCSTLSGDKNLDIFPVLRAYANMLFNCFAPRISKFLRTRPSFSGIQ